MPLLLICSTSLMVATVSAQIQSGEWSYTLNASNEATITAYSGSDSNVEVPATIDGHPVRQVGNYATQGYIGGGMYGGGYFYTIPAVPVFGQSLQSVRIPNGIQIIGENTFASCNNLASADLPATLTTIGAGAFQNTGLQSVTIPPSVTSLGSGVFLGCNNLASASVPARFALSLSTHGFSGEAAISILSELIAQKILQTLPGNYGIATKNDLAGAIADATAQAVSQVQSNPNDHNLYSADQYAANYNNGVVTGAALVTANPSSYNLYTQNNYESFGALQFSNGVSSVLTNPSFFNLFTQQDFDSNRAAGQSDVINNPASYNLYTSESIMDLRMEGLMIPKTGGVASVTFQPQTTTNLATKPFTNNGAPITFDIPMSANHSFMRVEAKPFSTPVPPQP